MDRPRLGVPYGTHSRSLAALVPSGFRMRPLLNGATLDRRDMRTLALPEGELGKTFVPPMQDVTEGGGADVDVWPYVLAIPRDELGGLAFREGVVEHVYRSADGRLDRLPGRS